MLLLFQDKMLCKDVCQCDDGTQIETCLYVKSRKPPFRYTYGYMFNAVLSDKTGDIDLVYFGGTNEDEVRSVFTSFKIGDVVKVNGQVGSYQGNKQITIGDRTPGEIRLANESEYDISKFLVETNKDIDEMWKHILELIDSIKEPFLRQLLENFKEDDELIELFKTVPGARLYHHACKGGLLEHIWETIQYCELAVYIHPSLNRDLILCGAILHDIGKIKENAIGQSIIETQEGMLLGHIYLGIDLVKEKIAEIPDFPDLLENKLIHIILSHHGKTEYGAGIEPKTPEAITVSTADVMGSAITQYIRARKDSYGDDFKTWRDPIGWVFRI